MTARPDSRRRAGRLAGIGRTRPAAHACRSLSGLAGGRTTLCRAAAWAAALSFAACLPLAAAQTVQPWHCADADELPAFSLGKGPLVLNNFSLREQNGMFSRRPYLELSFSAVNRGDDPYFLTVQFLAFDDKRLPVFAISAEPTFSIVSEHSADQVTASVNAFSGELRSMAFFCLRADGDFQ